MTIINCIYFWLRLLSVLSGGASVVAVVVDDGYSLFIFATIVCRVVVSGPCFVMQYLVSFLVLQSSRGRREDWLLYFDIVFWMLSCVSSSWCRGLVNSVWIVAFPGLTHLFF